MLTRRIFLRLILFIIKSVMVIKTENKSDKINLVVGAGFSGAVIAERIANALNEKVLIIDRRAHLGGNSYDYVDKNGILIHQYGSHIFHTNSEKVWNYVNKFTEFNTYMHKVYALLDGILTTIPFNMNSIYEVFPKSIAQKLEYKLLQSFPYNSKVPILEFQKSKDKDLIFLSNYIYEKVFLNYTMKQWGENPKQIDGAVTARVPVMIGKDERYFQDKYQGLPVLGYTKLIENMLNHHNIEIELDTSFEDVLDNRFKRVFYTGSIDEFFNYKFGMLSYRSVYFKMSEHNTEFYQQNSVVNYPNNYDFTRIHEYKHYYKNSSAKTVIAKEYSQDFVHGKNERYYPIKSEKNIALYNRYFDYSKQFSNVYFLGRLGDYKYYDMDKAILRALELFDIIFKTNENTEKAGV